MTKVDERKVSRRSVVTQLACGGGALMGFSGCALFAKSQTNLKPSSSPPRKTESPFDERMAPLSYREYHELDLNKYIAFAKFLKKELGNQRTLELIKRYKAEWGQWYGQYQAKQVAKVDLRHYVEQFKNPEFYGNRLSFEIVEESEIVFDIRVTSCIWAETFIAANAADIGYATNCWADYAWAQGYSKRLKLYRDKTIMEGKPICNHRYVWEG